MRASALPILARWDADDGMRPQVHGELITPRYAAATAPKAAGESRGAAPVAGTVSVPLATSDSKLEQLKDWLRHYSRTRIDSRTIDERRTIPPHIVLDFGNEGLLGMQIDNAYGGLGLTHREMLEVLSQLAAIDTTLAFFVGLNNSLGIRPIMLHGQPALRDELLPLLAGGRMLAAFALSEPAAGSNVRAIAASAERIDNGDWLVNGVKSWSGSSAWAGVVNVFARQTDGSGMVGLAIRQGTPGFRIGPEDLTMGVRGMIQNTLYLDDARVSDACRLGELGQGMAVAQQTMNFTRLGVGGICLGAMKRCAQLMHRYAARRSIGTGLLLDNPLSRDRLDDLRHRIDALNVLVEQLTADLDAGRAAPEDGFLIAKTLGSEFLSDAADELMQMLGGRGYIESNLVPQIFRDARLPRIFEGPTETLLAHLGSRLRNSSDDLSSYLVGRLGAAALATELRDICLQLIQDGQANEARLGGAAHVTNWLNYWLGTIAQWALLMAVVERAASCRSVDSATVDWVRTRYDLAAETAQRQVCRRRTLPSAAQLSDWGRQLGREIGAIEQTVPAARQQRDAMLLAEVAASGRDSLCGANAEGASHVAGERGRIAERSVTLCNVPAREVAIDSGSKQQIEEWLTAWLGKRLADRRITVTTGTSFSDVGLDSVLAIELTMAVSDAFGVSVDASAVWDYSSVESLSAYLASKLEGSPDKNVGLVCAAPDTCSPV
jgi:alkylation response protein AidB-like acyl-CoA dehydrogenase/acyl carrier protein